MKVTIAVVAMLSLASCEGQSPHLEDTPRMSPSIRIIGLISAPVEPTGLLRTAPVEVSPGRPTHLKFDRRRRP